jgi:hypothetical protein
MDELQFKGFGAYDGTKKDFDITKLEDGYVHFIRTDANGENGYIYFNGRKYGVGGGGSVITGIDAGEY